MMKNITIALLVFITITAMLYAFVQKAEADKQRMYAEENYQRAVQQNKIAEEQKLLAKELQFKSDLIGEYKHSVFMYSFTLRLKDGKNYEMVETSDLGSEKTLGIWTIRGQAIRLTPQKKIIVDVNKKQKEEYITDSKEEVVVIETKNVLVPQNKDFKLEKAK